MSFTFAPIAPTPVVETGMVRYARTQLMGAHKSRGQFVVMTGATGSGKTTTATHLASEVTAAYQQAVAQQASNIQPAAISDAYDARYFQVVDHRHTRQASIDVMQRRVITEFGLHVLGLPEPKDPRSINLPSYLAAVAHGLRLQQIQMAFIDEAGQLPSAGLECLANLLNLVATTHAHPMTIVLIGMEDLASNVRRVPHVFRRAQRWVPFRPCNRGEVLQVLGPIHPFFAGLTPGAADCEAVLDFVLQQEVTQCGVIGLVVQLAEMAVDYARATNKPMSLKMLELAHALKATSHA